jgi:hypothetical protein
MLELMIQLVIVMLGQMLLNNTAEWLLPWIAARTKALLCCCNPLKWCRLLCSPPKPDTSRMRPWEREFHKLTELPAQPLIPEYLDTVILFGFMVMFSVACPFIPLLLLLNMLYELRLDARKMLNQYRCAVSPRTGNIGLWADIVHVLGMLGVLVNGMVIAFTSTYIERMLYKIDTGSMAGFVATVYPQAPVGECHYRGLRDENGDYTTFYYRVIMAKLAFFIVFEQAVFLTKFAIAAAIPAVPTCGFICVCVLSLSS